MGAGIVLGLMTSVATAQSAFSLGDLPLWFEASPQSGQFVAHGADSEFSIAPTQATIVLRKANGEMAVCEMQFTGANNGSRISGTAELTGKINHLSGNQPAQWQTGMPAFAKVRVEDVYPGVNVVYYGNGHQLEYDFNVAAGVNPQTITLHFSGAEKISVNPKGELVVSLNGGEIIQHQPLIYQTLGANRHEIAGGYRILDAHTATFALGDYDRSQPLVIDPVLSYSTYFGGNNTDIAHAIAVDTNGFVYVAGETLSTTFTNIPAGGFQTNFLGGAVNGDAFVAKFDTTGRNLIYFTYLGGSANQSALGLAVDNSGNAFVTGYTQ